MPSTKPGDPVKDPATTLTERFAAMYTRTRGLKVSKMYTFCVAGSRAIAIGPSNAVESAVVLSGTGEAGPAPVPMKVVTL